MTTKNLANERGFITLLVSVGMMVLGVMALSSSSAINTSQTISANETSQKRAEWNALTGIEYAIHEINQGEDPTGEKILDQGSFEITTTSQGNEILVVSKGISSVAQVTYQVSVSANSGGGGTATGSSTSGTTTTGGTTTGTTSGTTTGGVTEDPPSPISNCAQLWCSHVQSAGRNLTDIKFWNGCEDPVEVTHMRIAPELDESEIITEIQIQGTDVYEDSTGISAQNTIDIIDFELPSYRQIPVNHIRFKNKLKNSKSYIFEATFNDGSMSHVSCSDHTKGSQKPPGFEMNGDGSFTVDPYCSTDFKTVCTDLNLDIGEWVVPVSIKINRAANGVYFNNWLFNGDPVYDGKIYTEINGGNPTTYKVKAFGQYNSFSANYESTYGPQARMFIDTDPVPSTWQGYGGAQTVGDCAGDYINPNNGEVDISNNQMLLLYEMDHDMSASPASSANFQDLIMLMTVHDCSE